METANELNETSLIITKELAAPIEKVFEAWKIPEIMTKWMGPGEITCKNVGIDFKVGGKYSIHMGSTEENHIAIGEYKQIIPNELLQFTWTWKDGEMPDTLVTVEFENLGEKTKLKLTHEQFPAKEAAEKHNQGWIGCFAKLEQLFS